MRRAVRSMGASIDAAEISMMLARSRLIFSTPALLARSLDLMQQIEDEIATILAERYQRLPDDLAIHVSAACMTTAFRVAVMRWVKQDNGPGLFELIEQALDVLAGGLRLEPAGAPDAR
jgi:hypothetical protein